MASRRVGKPIGKSSADADWKRLQQRSLDEAKTEQWGLYCNTLFEMAEFVMREGRKRVALDAFMAGCYLSLNGPNNLPTPGPIDFNDSDLPPRWQPEFGQPVTSHVFKIGELAHDLGFTIPETREVFLNIARLRQKTLHLPISPEEAWEEIERCIDDD